MQYFSIDFYLLLFENMIVFEILNILKYYNLYNI